MASTFKMTWDGDAFMGRYRKGVAKMLQDISVGLANKVKENLLVAGEKGTNESAPGEFPRAITKRLVNSIFAESGDMQLKVGFAVVHGFFMEKGVEGGKVIVPVRATVLSWIGKNGERCFARSVKQGKIEPRPFLGRSLMMFTPEIRSIMAKGRYF